MVFERVLPHEQYKPDYKPDHQWPDEHALGPWILNFVVSSVLKCEDNKDCGCDEEEGP